MTELPKTFLVINTMAFEVFTEPVGPALYKEIDIKLAPVAPPDTLIIAKRKKNKY